MPTMTAVPKLDIMLPPSADGSSFEMYRAASATHVQVSLPEGARAQDFFVDGATWQLPHATLSRVRSCAQLHRRGPDEIAGEGAPTIQLYLLLSGETVQPGDGSGEPVGPGDVVVRGSGGFETRTSDFDLRLVMTARDRVPPLFLSPGVDGLKLSAADAGTRLLAAAIEALLREIGGLTMAEADHAVAGLWQLAAGVVETRLARQDESRQPGPQTGAEPSLDAAMAFIDSRLADPQLGPEPLGAHLALSRSALYRLFAPLGGIEATIRRRRLDAAMHMILTEATTKLPTGVLASRHGFGGEAAFARAFQARFGATPAQVRGKVATGDEAWLQTQAARAGFASLEAWRAALAAG